MSYTGPPRTNPPPPDRRPSVVRDPAPPRRLPPQDHAALDAAERSARRFTWAVGAAALVAALMVALALAVQP